MQKTILVVEDEQPMRLAIMEALKTKNFLTLGAKNGIEGVQIALRDHPDLILLDILMPEMDGLTMLKKIRQDAWGKTVPVIILTNLNPTDEQVIEDVVTHKPLKYLIKADWKIFDVVKEINKVLGI